MDPTAPKDNRNSQNQTGSQPPSVSPIQPGQFVVAGEDGIFKEPPAPQTPPPTQEPVPEPPISTFTPPISSPPSSEIIPDTSAESSSLITPQTLPQTDPFSQVPVGVQQPNPSPYLAPQPPVPPTSSGANSSEDNPSIIKKLRVISVVIAFIILVIIIAAVAYFFVLNKKAKEPVKTGDGQSTAIEEPPSFPKRSGSGFADIPPATSEAVEATPSGQ